MEAGQDRQDSKKVEKSRADETRRCRRSGLEGGRQVIQIQDEMKRMRCGAVVEGGLPVPVDARAKRAVQ